MTQQTETQEQIFDVNGQTISDDQELEQIEVAPDEPEEAETPEVTEPNLQVNPQGKYRIGDKVFATQEEALAYAQTQVEVNPDLDKVNDAYRRGIMDAASLSPQPQNITPEIPESNINEEYYTNPQAYHEKLRHSIKQETLDEIRQQETLKEQSNQIWREFSERHPDLADFRNEVEQFVGQNTGTVRSIIQSKGRATSYDWVALKLRAQFENYANALKPKRVLPNGGTVTTPSSKATNVTPKPANKKPLSFVEQIRSIRAKGR